VVTQNEKREFGRKVKEFAFVCANSAGIREAAVRGVEP
jgi:hypothetical protein